MAWLLLNLLLAAPFSQSGWGYLCGSFLSTPTRITSRRRQAAQSASTGSSSRTAIRAHPRTRPAPGRPEPAEPETAQHPNTAMPSTPGGCIRPLPVTELCHNN
jgi:hypothetical protein